jgi:transposase
MHERTAHTNRISSLLVLHNLRPRIVIGGRDWAGWWQAHGTQVPPQLRAELERESARLALVKQQIKTLEAAQREAVEDGKQPLVAQLAQLRAIGPKGAWVLVKELFGWRRFANRRELAGCLGLAPTPYDSGGSQVEQGISKAGNANTYAPHALAAIDGQELTDVIDSSRTTNCLGSDRVRCEAYPAGAVERGSGSGGDRSGRGIV